MLKEKKNSEPYSVFDTKVLSFKTSNHTNMSVIETKLHNVLKTNYLIIFLGKRVAVLIFYLLTTNRKKYSKLL